MLPFYRVPSLVLDYAKTIVHGGFLESGTSMLLWDGTFHDSRLLPEGRVPFDRSHRWPWSDSLISCHLES